MQSHCSQPIKTIAHPCCDGNLLLHFFVAPRGYGSVMKMSFITLSDRVADSNVFPSSDPAHSSKSKPTSSRRNRDPKWRSQLQEFVKRVPLCESWPSDAMASHIDAVLSSSISEVTACPGAIWQLMKAFGKRLLSLMSSRIRKAHELVFLAAFVVLVHPTACCQREEVLAAVRSWYYDPELKDRTIMDRWNGAKWVGLVCADLFPL